MVVVPVTNGYPYVVAVAECAFTSTVFYQNVVFLDNLFLLLKNLPDERIKRTLVVKFFLDQVAAVFFLLQGHFKDFIAVYKAMRDFYKNYAHCKAKRNTLPKLAYTDTYPKSVVFLHYFKRKKIFNGTDFS